MDKYVHIENKSRVYFNGSLWSSNNCGEFEIVGKTDRHHVDKRGYKEFKYYLCKFEDNTIIEAKSSEIKEGKVRNPNQPSISNTGFLGEGEWKFYINQKPTKEYSLFHNIINRCYNNKSTSYEYYGGIGITLDDKLHNFQSFCDMLSRLSNYDEWKNDENNIWQLDKDEICERMSVHPKMYSEATCQFLLLKDNMSERNKRVSVTGHTYVGTSHDGIEYEFKNIKQFARDHNLYDSHIGRCIKGRAKQHKGWTFKVKETI